VLCDLARYTGFVKLFCDDGCIVYLNNQEVGRYNMPAGFTNSSTFAVRNIEGADELLVQEMTVPDTLILRGPNTLAVEVSHTPSSMLPFWVVSCRCHRDCSHCDCSHCDCSHCHWRFARLTLALLAHSR
jgi:hypothetical protein